MHGLEIVRRKKPRTNRNNTLYSSQSGVVASDLFFLLNLYQNWVFLPSFKMFNEPSPTDIFWPYKPQKVVPELLQNLHIAVSFRFQRFAPVNQRGLLKAVLKVKWLKLVRPSVLGSCIIRPAIFPSTRLSNVFPSHSATGRLATPLPNRPAKIRLCLATDLVWKKKSICVAFLCNTVRLRRKTFAIRYVTHFQVSFLVSALISSPRHWPGPGQEAEYPVSCQFPVSQTGNSLLRANNSTAIRFPFTGSLNRSFAAF